MSDDEKFPLGEAGRDEKGAPRLANFRLFIQLHAFGDCSDISPVRAAMQDRVKEDPEFEAVLYEDLNDPRGFAIAVAHRDENYFVARLRDFLQSKVFQMATPKPEFTMFGRTYSIGYETDLEEVLLHRPRRRLFNADIPWVVWYPLRRSGEFARLPKDEQRSILMEHASLGISFSKTGFGSDIRLACHGMDKNDNDYVIGLLGPELYPLSALVEAMRRTRQTSMYLESLGPFFVGRACWQSAPPLPAETGDGYAQETSAHAAK
jgi:chlorite dismutase